MRFLQNKANYLNQVNFIILTIPNLNLSLFIARRIAFKQQKSFSRFIARLAVTAIAFSIAAMILTLSFVNGFKHAITDKIYRFWGHIRIQQYEPNKAIIAEETALMGNDTIIQKIKNISNVMDVQPFATKSIILKNNETIEGLLLKGVDKNYAFNTLQPFLIAGRWPIFPDSTYSKEVVISITTAHKMNVNVNDSIYIYFINNDVASTRYRKVRVTGFYKTGIEDYDKLFALGDINLIRRLNNWQQKQVGGYEITLKNASMIDHINNQLFNLLPVEWTSRPIPEIYPNLFSWIDVQSVNERVVIVIMSIVAIINLITCLIILVLERTRMIGVLKALGANTLFIQKIFLYHATYISCVGIAIGCVVGVGIGLLQQQVGFIQLSEESYYMPTAPVLIDPFQIIVVCCVALAACFITLLLPTLLVTKVNPVKAIRFK